MWEDLEPDDLLDLAGTVLVALGLGTAVAGLMCSWVLLSLGTGGSVAGSVLVLAARHVAWLGDPRRAPAWHRRVFSRGLGGGT